MSVRPTVRDGRGDDRRSREEQYGGELDADEAYYDDDLDGDLDDDEAPYEVGEDQRDEVEHRARGGRAAGRRAEVRQAEVLSAPLAARAGMQHIADLAGKEPSGVTSLERADDGWLVGIEVVEEHRIPSSTDILGLYLTQVDSDGSLVTYRRTRRYSRGRGDSSEVI